MYKCWTCGKDARYEENTPSDFRKYYCSYECAAQRLNDILGSTFTKEDMQMFEYLKDYKPEKVADSGSSEPVMATVTAVVNKAQMSVMSSDNAEVNGQNILDIEVEAIEGDKHAGKRAYHRFWMDSTRERESGKNKGKTDGQVLADWLFSLGLEFKDEASLEQALTEFSEKTLVCFFYIRENKDKTQQYQDFVIRKEADVKGAKKERDSVPF